MYQTTLEHISYFDLIPPVGCARWALGYISLFHLFVCVVAVSLAFFWFVSCVMMYKIVISTCFGMTEFEVSHKIKLRDCRSLSDRLRETMGDNWVISVFLPFRTRSGSQEDAVHWPTIQPE